MNIGNWNYHYRTVWSIYDEASYKAYEEQRGMFIEHLYEQIKLDLSALDDMPDGEYSVVYKYLDKRGEASWVLVNDGEFVPTYTDLAFYKAISRAWGWSEEEIESGRASPGHIFIEKITWATGIDAVNPKLIEIHTGS